MYGARYEEVGQWKSQAVEDSRYVSVQGVAGPRWVTPCRCWISLVLLFTSVVRLYGVFHSTTRLSVQIMVKRMLKGGWWLMGMDVMDQEEGKMDMSERDRKDREREREREISREEEWSGVVGKESERERERERERKEREKGLCVSSQSVCTVPAVQCCVCSRSNRRKEGTAAKV